MTETVVKTATGAILYDQAIINQISESLFQPGGWPHSELLSGSGGRGNTHYVGNVPKQFVLRHFVRGGLPGKIIKDTYLWLGENETRSFAEWRLLAKLAEHDLRVPRPAAARYLKRGPIYTADIITVRIPRVLPLPNYIRDKNRGLEFWSAVGGAIFEFHFAGVRHADMNAYNLLIDSSGHLWMLDFDKGRLSPPGAWQQQTLNRLHRSLVKIKGRDPKIRFAKPDWDALLEGYFEASRSA